MDVNHFNSSDMTFIPSADKIPYLSIILNPERNPAYSRLEKSTSCNKNKLVNSVLYCRVTGNTAPIVYLHRGFGELTYPLCHTTVI